MISSWHLVYSSQQRQIGFVTTFVHHLYKIKAALYKTQIFASFMYEVHLIFL